MPAADPSVSGVPRVERIESALLARAIRPSGGDRAIRDERSAGVDFARRHRWRSVSASLRAIGHHAAARKPMFRERHDHCSHRESRSKTRYLLLEAAQAIERDHGRTNVFRNRSTQEKKFASELAAASLAAPMVAAACVKAVRRPQGRASPASWSRINFSARGKRICGWEIRLNRLTGIRP